jgi:hypothetical protein
MPDSNVNSNWPTLEGRLKNKLTSRCEALKQLKESGMTLSESAEKELKKCKKNKKS